MINRNDIDTLMSDGVVFDQDGDKIGKVGQVYLDDQTGEPEWVTVSTGFFGTSESFIPLADATTSGSELRVPYTKAIVKDAPRVDADQHLSETEEQELYRYYGTGGGAVGGDRGTVTGGTTDTTQVHDRDHTDRGTDVGTGTTGRDTTGTVGRDTTGPETDDAMTRSEERLDVHTEREHTGRARLRKYVVTENVTTTVPVEREEVRLEREPITDANRGDAVSGGNLTEEEHEVVLSEERVVVDKETVPVERVRLDKDVVTEEQQVSEDVRKEEIEADVPGQDGTVDPTNRR